MFQEGILRFRSVRGNAMRILVAVLLGSAAVEAAGIDARFIGNSAFELSDGTSTILLDFPYESGAFGYMSFAPAEIHRRVNALCLFTHRHADHFDPEAIADVGCTVAGPNDVQALVPEPLRAGPGPVWHFGGATIECITTAHGRVEHCSYLIRWHGVRILVSGDIESLEVLDDREQNVDVAFLSSWLAAGVEPGNSFGSQARVVIHHHAPEEDVRCRGCLVPSQGERFVIAAGNDVSRLDIRRGPESAIAFAE